jgi:hypothetical protein
MLLVLLTGRLNAKTSEQDSLLLARIYTFQRNFTHEVRGFATNVYIKHLYQTHRRNVGLWAIPSTYAIAKGQRFFVSEQYSRLYFRSISDFDHLRQVYYTTIPRNRRTLPILSEFITPNLYDVTMYGDHILSPFCKENKRFYKFSTAYLDHGKVRLYFRPRILPNTQLVKGKAIVDATTGQIEQLEMEGEFDMIRFRTLTQQGDYGARALLPKLCKTSIEFKFGGNHITSDFTALFDCPITLPDTVDVKGDRLLIDSLRPISLSEAEQAVYQEYDLSHREEPDTTEQMDVQIDTTLVSAWKQESVDYTTLAEETQQPEKRHHDYWKEIGWDLLGSNLIRSIRSESENGYVRLYPILDPQYLSYSSSKGLSYKIKLNAEYRFSPKTTFETRPRVGYRFKFHELYFTLPFWLYYSPKKECVWYLDISKNNRIGNVYVLEEIANLLSDSPENIEDMRWHYFGDNMVHLTHSMKLTKQLMFSAGMTFHSRKGVHAKKLRELDLPDNYYSLAPAISFAWRPWPKAPVFTVDYERTIPGRHLNVDYERWEGDVSAIYHLPHLQMINMRVGAGLYTHRKGFYFTDFANFRDNNLPEGWNDDWSGDFQLLDSRLYNDSKYYVRSNISYEAPMIAAFTIPVVGRYVERERFYWNGLSIEHSRLYSEFGYAFTTRVFSMGLFASFLNTEYQRFTTKFTFELFRRW